jgi:hypothetical protein
MDAASLLLALNHAPRIVSPVDAAARGPQRLAGSALRNGIAVFPGCFWCSRRCAVARIEY